MIIYLLVTERRVFVFVFLHLGYHASVLGNSVF